MITFYFYFLFYGKKKIKVKNVFSIPKIFLNKISKVHKF